MLTPDEQQVMQEGGLTADDIVTATAQADERGGGGGDPQHGTDAQGQGAAAQGVGDTTTAPVPNKRQRFGRQIDETVARTRRTKLCKHEDDINSPVTDTTKEDISRDVNVIVGPSAFGNKTNI